jgi:hypothetical protein
MTDCDYFNHWHLVYALPVWTLGTWLLILILAWCVTTLKRMVEHMDDKIDELQARQDAYFGVGSSAQTAEAIRMRDMEVRRLRGQRTDDDDC